MMGRIAGCAFALSFLLPSLGLSASLKDYESRLQLVLETMRSANAQDREAALKQLSALFSPEEQISLGNQTIRVNNTWIHESLQAYDEEPDRTKRDAIYSGLQNRLAALLEHVQQAKQPIGDARRERQHLAAILNQQGFQRHRTETWMSRLRQWVRERLARLFDLFPKWQRGGSPFARGLEILVGLLAAGVLVLSIRRILSRFRREERVRPSSHQVILGVPIESYATSGDLRGKALALAQQGDYRGAIRYLYISLLYDLQERGWLELNAAATNGEYLRQLRSAVTIYPAMLFLTRQFDRVWYGKASLSEPEYQEFFNQYQIAVSALTGQ
jgi:hypothetical protein